MVEGAELVRVEAGDGGLLGQGHGRVHAMDERRSSLGERAEHLATVFSTGPRHQTPALQPVHQSSHPGRPLEKPIGNFKRWKAFGAGIRQNPEDIVLLERDSVSRQFALEDGSDAIRDREK